MTKNKDYLVKESKHFCMAPWVTMHLWPSGEAMPCCVVVPDEDTPFSGKLGNIQDNSISDLWNSSLMKELRTNMLADKPSQTCERCIKQEAAGNQYTLRRELNKDFSDYFYSTQEPNQDGSHDDPKIYYWDVRFNNLCNLRCLSCSVKFSSSWYNDSVKRHEYDGPALLQLPKSFWEEALPLIGEVQHAYFAGGEPLMTEEHYRMLDTWIEAGNTDLKISYTTNFTKTRLGNRYIFDYWNKFSNVHVGASLDDNWERAEYLRKDTVWTDIVQNRKDMIKDSPDTRFFLSSTIGIFNVLHWPDFHKEWIEEELVDPIDFNLTLLTHPEYLSMTVMPTEFKKRVEKRWLEHRDYIEKAFYHAHPDWDYRPDHMQSMIDGLLKYLWSEDNSQLIDRFHDEQRWMDKIRNNDCYDVYTELEELKTYGDHYEKVANRGW